MPMLFQRTETQDKQPASIGRQQSTSFFDWRILAVIVISLFLLWGTLYGVTSYECYNSFRYCTAREIVLWIVPIILLSSIISFTSVKLIGAYHEAQRKRLANAIDEHYDYRNIDRTLENRLMDIAYRLSESYGTAEVDTWSPEYHNRSNSDTKEPAQPNVSNPLEKTQISIADIFNSKDD